PSPRPLKLWRSAGVEPPATLMAPDLFRRRGLRLDGDRGAAVAGGMERHRAFDQREQRVVLADADIAAGMPFGAALADDDVAGDDALAAELLHAEAAA